MLSLLLLHVRCGKIGISGTAESGETLATQPPKRVPSWHFPPFLLAGTGLCSLLTFRGLLLCEASQRFRDNPVRCKSAASHHMAHGLDNPQGRTCNLPCQEKALESLPRWSFPDRMCANQQPRRRTGAVFIWPPERSLERVSAEILLAGSSPRAVFYTPAAQVVEQRSPKPHVAGSSPAWSACVPYEGAAQ